MSEINQLPENLKGVHIHFVGIKGTGMAALVEILYSCGAVITGSDVEERFYTDEILEKMNIKVLPFDAKNITDKIQYVIYSSAYKPDVNPDLIQAMKMKIPCLLYTQALGSYSSKAYSCGICGVHGKTSTTGLTGTILKKLDFIPSQVLAGSVINSFGNTCTYTSSLVKNNPDVCKNVNSGTRIFVAETCEYQRHFMSFCPQKIILTSVESDHQDCYPTYEDIRDAFVDYICKLPENGDLIYCADDKGAVETALLAYNKRPDIKLIPYGQNAGGDFKLTYKAVEHEKNKFAIKLFENENPSSEFYLKVPGKHEVLDAAAAVTLVCQLIRFYGKHPKDYEKQIAQGFADFSGGKRRSEIVRNFKSRSGNDVLVIDDYGHHPTAVKTTLEGFREFYKGRKIIVDFMSHTYSRTQALLKEFAECTESADIIILNKIYSSAREKASDFNITGKTLYEETLKHIEKKLKEGKIDIKADEKVYYFEEPLDSVDFIRGEIDKPLSEDYPDGYLFVTMGAGDNWKIGKEI
ncbi:MAG: UDP-N-acetylmuramate--L-alanine ligase [Treponema sp.]|nr:UDP-N-acetylmuramate--L-alanine ligase [Treponema sp.]